MTARRAYVLGAVLALAALATAYTFIDKRLAAQAAFEPAVPECDTCSARKKDMARLRGVLGTVPEADD